MFSNPISVSGTSSRLNEVLELLRKLMKYRSSEARQRLEKVGRTASMLYMDVLLLIYHFARFSAGNILEIGPYVGGSTVGAAFGARDSVTGKTIVSIEAGGQLKHFRLASRNIINDLRKNLARFGVAGDVNLINGRSFDEATISKVRQRLSNSDLGLFFFDADNNVRRDLDSYGELLNDGCWVVIDDYFGPAKAASLRQQVDALVSEGRLLSFGYTDGHLGRPMASQIIRSECNRKVRVYLWPRNQLCSLGQKALTKSGFIRKINTRFLPCSPRNLFHLRLQAACQPSFNSRRRRCAPLVPCAI